MAETLLQKAQRLNIKPATSPGVTPAPVATSSNETLLQKAQRLGIQPAQTTEAPKSSGIGGFLKSLVSAPLTIAARPLEAVAELSGASKEDVDTAASKLSGGLVAPVPQNLSDVKKDVGRGVQTAAFGLGPLSGGAAFGFGNSLEQGNDVFSGQTALQTALGLGAGKVLDLVGKPLLNAAGKVIGKITPEVLSGITSKGSKAIQDFAVANKILPDSLSSPLNAGAKGLENFANKPFELGKKGATVVGDIFKKQYPSFGDPTENKFNQAVTDVAGQYQKTLPLTPSQQAKEATLLTRTGDNTYTTYAKNGVNIGSDQAHGQLQDISDHFRNAVEKAQDNENAYFNVDEIRRNAHSSIDETLSSAKERTTAKSTVDSEIDELMKEKPSSFTKNAQGNTIANSEIVERLRKTGNDWAQYNKINPDSVKNASGRAFGNAVRDQVEKEGTFPAYREASREWGKIIHAQEVLSNIERSGKGFKTPGGLSGSISRKVLSGILGYHAAGVAGSILAELGSEYGAKILSNPELRTYLDRQIIEKFASKDPTPKAIAVLEQQVRDFIDKQSNLKALPAPSYIPMGGPSQSGAIPVQPTTADELFRAQKATGTVSKPRLLQSPGNNPIRLNGKR